MNDEQTPPDNNDANDNAQAEPGEVEAKKPNNLGRIEWLDLTVPDATRLRNFYRDVVGWTTSDVDMGAYADYCMNVPEGNETIAGVCHARGMNANMPPQWLVYVRVADVQESAETCLQKGGKVLEGPKRLGNSDFVVIQDPAGAVMALLSDRKTKNSSETPAES